MGIPSQARLFAAPEAEGGHHREPIKMGSREELGELRAGLAKEPQGRAASWKRCGEVMPEESRGLALPWSIT